MGQRGSAACKCGYGESVTLGGGRSNHLWFAGYPYICRSCSAVFTGNLYEEASSCRHCESSDTSSYEDAALWEPRDAADHAEAFEWGIHIDQPLPEPPKGLLRKLWRKLRGEPKRRSVRREIVLYSGGYRCPKCDEFSLSFQASSFFD